MLENSKEIRAKRHYRHKRPETEKRGKRSQGNKQRQNVWSPGTETMYGKENDEGGRRSEHLDVKAKTTATELFDEMEKLNK
ncbi:hypothetical protein I7I48_10990 [Histoplasma ohiense]|nr:hypothetical protein I7I48_10990 [Histoplasma ohiense (nom. inval.)]